MAEPSETRRLTRDALRARLTDFVAATYTSSTDLLGSGVVAVAAVVLLDVVSAEDKGLSKLLLWGASVLLFLTVRAFTRIGAILSGSRLSRGDQLWPVLTGFAEMVAFLTLSDRFAAAPFEIAWLLSHACQALFAGLLIHNRIALLKPEDYADDLSAFVAFYKPWMDSGRNATWGWGAVLALCTAGTFAASLVGFGDVRVLVADVLAAAAVIISMVALGRTGVVFDRFAELVHADGD
jgi:hypothetical protein